ncbi:MAG: helix-turn-helix transcriptional regulator [Fimbriimonadaceae bacterium]|nr:helix-turn-helix transcriptional regulator [Fimbriimonadaceae bacterium]
MSVLLPGKINSSPIAPRWVKNGASVSGWQSHGGGARLHPARAFPQRLVIQVPEGAQRVSKVVLRGIFALYAQLSHEPVGAIGASLNFLGSDGSVLSNFTLINGRHYGDATDGVSLDRMNGDGSRLLSVGTVDVEGTPCRVDELTIDLGHQLPIASIEFRDLGTPASFVIFEAEFETESKAVCPFRGYGDKISLGEIGSLVRLRDWPKLEQALAQLKEGILISKELDEAKGSVLTFLAVLSAALLDFGVERKLHRFQLDAARKLDQISTREEICEVATSLFEFLTMDVMSSDRSPSQAAIEKALRMIESNFAKSVRDDDIAGRVGMSTSHFRHLFRERTGEPFHKYVLHLRLEKARQQIIASDLPIQEISSGMGFVSSAHFSRAFLQRFGISPSTLRQGAEKARI